MEVKFIKLWSILLNKSMEFYLNLLKLIYLRHIALMKNLMNIFKQMKSFTFSNLKEAMLLFLLDMIVGHLLYQE